MLSAENINHWLVIGYMLLVKQNITSLEYTFRIDNTAAVFWDEREIITKKKLKDFTIQLR